MMNQISTRFTTELNIILVLLNTIGSVPLHFEFHHKESFSLTQDDDWGTNEDYGEDTGSRRVRRSAAKWVPDYDLYAQWAEEYYQDNPEVLEEQTPPPTSPPPPPPVVKDAEKKTKSHEGLFNAFQYATFGVGVLLFLCICKRKLRSSSSSCCKVSSIRDKVRKKANDLVPGVYIHSDGRTEFYTPTAEELEAADDLKKLLFSFF